MFKVVPLKKEHIDYLLAQKLNLPVKDSFTQSMKDGLEKTKSETIMCDDIPMFCGGVIQIWPGRGQIWCLFNEESKPCFLPVFRRIKKFLDNCDFDRMELSVPIGLEVGVRRARMLGFKVECDLARKFLPGGIDCTLFSRVR